MPLLVLLLLLGLIAALVIVIRGSAKQDAKQIEVKNEDEKEEE